MNTRPFIPKFLQKLDDRLLLNKPTTWSARTHLVLYFATLFAFVIGLICFLFFSEAKSYSNVENWVIFIGMISFIGFVFWVIFLLRFNVFKRYGNWFVWDGLKTFILYFVSIGSMVAVCFIPSAIDTFRANQQFGNEEIVSDINELNIAACKLEYNILPMEWGIDTFQVVPISVSNRVRPNDDDAMEEIAVQVEHVNTSTYSYIDSIQWESKQSNIDSVIKLNDSVFVVYECPTYVFVSSYNADDYSAKKILKSAEIYRTALRDFKKPDRAALFQRMEYFKKKYAVNGRYYDDDGYDVDDSYSVKISKKYLLKKINNGINNIVDKKYYWIKYWDDNLRGFYYTALIATLVVFIFRHSTAKTFFLSLLAALLLTIFSAFLIAISNGRESTILSYILLYYVIFLAITLTIFSSTKRSAIQGIGLNCLMFMTPFVPLILVALDDSLRTTNYNDPNYYRNEALYYLIAEIAGGVILLILIEPFFRNAYRKWYASPEQ